MGGWVLAGTSGKQSAAPQRAQPPAALAGPPQLPIRCLVQCSTRTGGVGAAERPLCRPVNGHTADDAGHWQDLQRVRQGEGSGSGEPSSERTRLEVQGSGRAVAEGKSGRHALCIWVRPNSSGSRRQLGQQEAARGARGPIN